MRRTISLLLIYLLVILPCHVAGTPWVWDGGGADDKWTTAENWTADASYPQSAADTVLFDNTSDDYCSLDVDISIGRMRLTNEYGGRFAAPSRTITLSYGLIHDGTGTSDWGNKIIKTGDGDTIHFGSGIGTATVNKCSLDIQGSAYLDIDKNFASTFVLIRDVKLAYPGKTVTNIGANNAGIMNGVLTVNGGTFALAHSFTHYPDVANFLSNTGTISGAGVYVVYPLAASVNVNIGTVSSRLWLRKNSANKVKFEQTAVLKCTGTNAVIGNDNSTDTMFYNSNGYAINIANLYLGSATASTNTRYDFFASKCTTALFDAASNNSGNTVINLNTAQLVNTGNFLIGSNVALQPGTSSLTETGNASITLAGDSLYDLTVNSSGTVTMVDAWAVKNDLTVLAGNWTSSGQSGYVGDDCLFDNAGTVTGGTSLTVGGDFHVGSPVTTATLSSTDINMVGTGSFDIDEAGAYVDDLTGAAAGQTTTITSASSTTGWDNILTVGPGTMTITDATLRGQIVAQTDPLSINASSTINGNGTLFLVIANTSTYAGNVPAITMGGTSTFSITRTTGSTPVTLTQTGAVSAPIVAIYSGCGNAAGTFTYLTGNYGLSGSTSLGTGANTANAISLFKYGSSSVSCGSYVNTYNTGSSMIDSMQSSSWTCAGNWTNGSNHTIVWGTSKQTFTGAATLTSAGKGLADSVIINATGATVATADAASMGALNVIAGTLNISGDSLTIARGAAVASGATLTTDASSKIAFTGDGARVYLGTKTTWPVTYFHNNGYLYDGGTLVRLIRAVDGKTLTLEAAKTFTLTAADAANLDGAAGSRNVWRSTTPGTQYTVALPNALTLSYQDAQDFNASGYAITATDKTSVNSGNNVNWIWPSSATTGDIGNGYRGGAYRNGAYRGGARR